MKKKYGRLEQLFDNDRFVNIPKKGKEVIIFDMPMHKDFTDTKTEVKKLRMFSWEAEKVLDGKALFQPRNLFNRRITKMNSLIATTNSIVYANAVKDDRVCDYI